MKANFKKSLLLFSLLGLLVFTSCGTSKFFSQRSPDIRPIAMIEPYAYITDAVADFSTKYLKETSQMNQELVLGVVTSIGLPVEKYIAYDYDYADPKSPMNRWMRDLVGLGAEGARTLVVPAAFCDAVKKSGCRYGMILSDVGFVKSSQEYAAELAVEVGLKVIEFLGSNSLDISKDTERYMNGMSSLIFDSQTGEVVWYGARPRDYRHNPLDRGDLADQIRKLYKDFL